MVRAIGEAGRGGAWHRWAVTETPGGSVAKRTAFLYDKNNVIADYIGVTPILERFYITPGLDQNLSMTTVNVTPATYYYSQDGLGSIRTLSNTTGIVQNQYDYSVFGETYNTRADITQRYAYAGREQFALAEGGMFYRHRNYYTKIGRFIWRDPTDYKNNQYGNFYDYVYSKPNMYNDPMGEGPYYDMAKNSAKKFLKCVMLPACTACLGSIAAVEITCFAYSEYTEDYYSCFCNAAKNDYMLNAVCGFCTAAIPVALQGACRASGY